MDFFKVTNLGRINNDQGPQSQRKNAAAANGKVLESDSKRAKWGARQEPEMKPPKGHQSQTIDQREGSSSILSGQQPIS